jgi:hypothetical protein
MSAYHLHLAMAFIPSVRRSERLAIARETSDAPITRAWSREGILGGTRARSAHRSVPKRRSSRLRAIVEYAFDAHRLNGRGTPEFSSL